MLSYYHYDYRIYTLYIYPILLQSVIDLILLLDAEL